MLGAHRGQIRQAEPGYQTPAAFAGQCRSLGALPKPPASIPNRSAPGEEGGRGSKTWSDSHSNWYINWGQVTIAGEAALDGIYVIRTSLPAEAAPARGSSTDPFPAEQIVRAYKGLAVAERAFRSLKTVDLKVRPIYHWSADRVRTHVLLCRLAYYVEWHMRQAWAPLLLDDDDRPTAQAQRTSIVAPAQRSPRAQRKAASHCTSAAAQKPTEAQTPASLPVHSFQTLLADLATLAKNRVRFDGSDTATMTIYTQPTPLQQQALNLLQVTL